MKNRKLGGIPSEARSESPNSRLGNRLLCFVLLFLTALIPVISCAQTLQSKPAGAEPIPEPAVPAILAAFDKYEVVGMPEGHGMEDEDHFLLSLIRNPGFPEKVNDIEVECGNSLYQPVLDRYIAGGDVPFTEVRKVWRNTTQTTCGTWAFFEQFFPLVRAINQKVRPERRLRVLAGDPAIDWDGAKGPDDIARFFDRDATIASVMEKEVLSKHRKALMLFGTFHLFHGVRSAVSTYEKDYPGVTFIISDLGIFGADSPTLSSSPFAAWPVPSLTRAKGTWLGALELAHFLPAPIRMDKECNVLTEFPKAFQRPMEDFVDAFIYVGPPSLPLKEKMPGDVALDADYMKELERREGLSGFPSSGPGTLKDFLEQIVNSAENPFLVVPKPPDLKPMVQSCLERKSHSSQLCLPKMLSGANAFKISNLQEAEKGSIASQAIRT
jgi:hypothetical protein